MTLDDLLAAAETIKNENGVGKNTSTRVGALLANMINYFATNLSTETQKLIDEAVRKYTSGVRKGMTVQFDPDLPLPAGFVFSNGNGGVKINGVTIPDWRGRVPVGFDPLSPTTPTNAGDLTKNYGKVGNTGGKSWYKLTGRQSGIQKHRHPIAGTDGNDQSSTKGREMNPNPDSTEDYGNKTKYVEHSDALDDHDNRMEYGVAYWITKYSDDVVGEGGVTVYQIEHVITTANGVMNEITFEVEGNDTFPLPVNFDYDHDYTIYDGGIMVRPIIDRVAATAKFKKVPLLGNEITYKYYPL